MISKEDMLQKQPYPSSSEPMSIKQLRSMIVNENSRKVAHKIKDVNKTLNAEVQYLSAEIEEINSMKRQKEKMDQQAKENARRMGREIKETFKIDSKIKFNLNNDNKNDSSQQVLTQKETPAAKNMMNMKINTNDLLGQIATPQSKQLSPSPPPLNIDTGHQPWSANSDLIQQQTTPQVVNSATLGQKKLQKEKMGSDNPSFTILPQIKSKTAAKKQVIFSKSSKKVHTKAGSTVAGAHDLNNLPSSDMNKITSQLYNLPDSTTKKLGQPSSRATRLQRFASIDIKAGQIIEKTRNSAKMVRNQSYTAGKVQPFLGGGGQPQTNRNYGSSFRIKGGSSSLFSNDYQHQTQTHHRGAKADLRNMVPDRVQERNDIIKRQKQIDKLIEAGLRAQGVELDFAEQRRQEIMATTTEASSQEQEMRRGEAQGEHIIADGQQDYYQQQSEQYLFNGQMGSAGGYGVNGLGVGGTGAVTPDDHQSNMFGMSLATGSPLNRSPAGSIHSGSVYNGLQLQMQPSQQKSPLGLGNKNYFQNDGDNPNDQEATATNALNHIDADDVDVDIQLPRRQRRKTRFGAIQVYEGHTPLDIKVSKLLGDEPLVTPTPDQNRDKDESVSPPNKNKYVKEDLTMPMKRQDNIKSAQRKRKADKAELEKHENMQTFMMTQKNSRENLAKDEGQILKSMVTSKLDRFTFYKNLQAKSPQEVISLDTANMLYQSSVEEGDKTQFYKAGAWAEKTQMRETDQKYYLELIGFEGPQISEFIDDPRLQALAEIKIQTYEVKETAKAKELREIQEIVAFLLSEDSKQSPMVQKVVERLLAKVYQKSYNDATLDNEMFAVDFTREIRDKKVYYDMCKHHLKPSVQHSNQMNYMYKYYERCVKERVVALPILFRVRNGCLHLKNYSISEGVARSVVTAIETNPELINSINLTQNGLPDKNMRIIMEGIKKIVMRSVVIKNNCFDMESLEHLKEITAKVPPESLEELRMVSLTSNPMCISDLVSHLATTCNLRKLSLVQLGLTDSTVENLVYLLQEARFLQEFDISYNNFSVTYITEITGELATSKQLRYVNLSWNHLAETVKMPDYYPGIHEMEHGPRILSKLPGSIQESTQRRIAQKRMSQMSMANRDQVQPSALTYRTESQLSAAKNADENRSSQLSGMQRSFQSFLLRQLNWRNYQADLTKQNEALGSKNTSQFDEETTRIMPGDRNQKVVEDLCQLIKRNKQLMHLDLSHCNLTEYMLWMTGMSLSKAKSLVSVHFSGNQGITPTLKQQLFTRIRCAPKRPHYKVSLKQGMEMTEYGGDKLKTNQVEKPVNQIQIQESMQIRQLQNEVVETGQIVSKQGKDYRKLIFERNLGHKNEMRGSGQWRQLCEDYEDCWTCENQIYTLVFWTPQYGWNDTESIDPMEEENLLQQLDKINGNFQGQKIDQIKYLCGKTSWKPKKLKKVEDFFYELDKTKPDHFQILKDRGTIRDDLSSPEDMNENERQKFDEYTIRFKKMNYTTSEDIKKIIIRDCQYKKMQFVNPQLIANLDNTDSEFDLEKNQIYVFAHFMKPGRQLYVICQPDPMGDLQFFTHKFLAKKRTEEIPHFQKESKTRSLVRVFRKNDSVFKEWIKDGKETAKNAIAHDLQIWHANKFIKDEEDLEKTKEVFLKYAQILKDIFIQVASHSNFPQIGWVDFASFSSKCQFADKNPGGFASSQIDTQVVAAKNDPVITPGMDAQYLMRYQYLECIARIARSKYVEQKRVETVAEACEKLITDCIIKNYTWEPWQDYREQVLYVLEVDDVLKTNLEGIEKVMKAYHAPRKNFMNKKDFVSLVTRDSRVMIGEKEAIYSLAMSKMTVVLETKTPKQYDIIALPEMCEALGRVADYKYRSQTSLTIAQKLELLLDDVFTFINWKRKEVSQEIEEVSESDDEY